MIDTLKDNPVILCVDDEASILSSLERCFGSTGCTILKALSGEEALAQLEQMGGKVDLLVVDQKMPGMMGDAFLKIVHEKYGELTTIMLSGYADIEELHRVVNVGHFVRFLSKPWNNQELLAVARGVLHMRDTAQAQ